MKPVVWLLLLASAGAQTPKAAVTSEILLQHHLDSIGPPEVRAATTARGAEGTVEFAMTQGGGARIGGRSGLATLSGMLRIAFQFDARDYPGEDIVFDGNKGFVATTTNLNRSELGDFLHRNPIILQEGLFGGVLSTAWPLFDLEKRKAKLKYLGLKSLEGEELHAVVYEPKKKGDVSIKIYFEPATYRHVATTYDLVIAPPMTSSQTTRLEATYFKIIERFSEFQQFDGLNLPRAWRIRYSVSPVRAREAQWNVLFSRISHRVKYPAEAFKR